MKRLVISLSLALAVSMVSAGWCKDPAPQAKQLDKANVLPLALDDHFEFRKTKLFLNDPKTFTPTEDPMIIFERDRINFGAVTGVDRAARMGNYFTFFWRCSVKADVTIRLEYRQENLGAYVQAREISYTGAKGSMQTDFKIIGDDYRQDGRVTAWRALIIENGKIVGLTASNLWD
ncbi:MAG TPA: hypothetical protein VG733_16745 [Chthoniobacteraceae bacterium]|nr:hypothetical protein [Chthoniobacteraceae bacterium]